MNARKGISPVLATVIIIAVTLVIAIGVIGWIMGIWGSFGTTESLQVFPDSNIDTGSNTLTLHVKNTGTASAVIYKVEIVGVETVTSFGTVTTVAISPGVDTTLSISLTGTYTPGTYYTVKIYTQAGNIYTAQVRAQ